MTSLIPAQDPSAVRVELVNGHPTTTSLDIAAHFGKRHDTVLRAIRQLDCSPEFTLRNFAECSRPGANNKPEPYFRITRDGFTFLAMGFTGKEAARWKEAYIAAFNALEAEQLKPARDPEGAAIRAHIFNARYLTCFDPEGRVHMQQLNRGDYIIPVAQLLKVYDAMRQIKEFCDYYELHAQRRSQPPGT